jgi:hypothetical protein
MLCFAREFFFVHDGKMDAVITLLVRVLASTVIGFCDLFFFILF